MKKIILITLIILLALVGTGWADDVIFQQTTANSGSPINSTVLARFAAFTCGVSGKILTSATIMLYPDGSPTGHVYAKLYDVGTGTVGTDAKPTTTTAIATSNAVDLTSLPAGYNDISFTFAGVNQISLVNGHDYVIAAYSDDISGQIYVKNSGNTTISGANGNYYNGDWVATTTDVPVTTVYGVTGTPPPSASISAATNVAQTILTGVGSSTDGGETVSERGILLKAGGTPTTSSYDFKLTSSGTSGAFAGTGMNATGLTANTAYTARAYVITDVTGTTYSTTTTYTTLRATTSFYIKNGGDDSAAGTSGAPWAHCPGMVTWTGTATLIDGDTVYFDNQSSWTSTVDPDGHVGSFVIRPPGGTSSAITYDGTSWGAGTPGTNRAKFIAGNPESLSAMYTGIITILDSHIIFKGCEVDGASLYDYGINIGEYASGNVNDVTVDNCYVHDVGNPAHDPNVTGEWPYGIIVSASSGHTTSNVTIKNSEIYLVYNDGGISIYPAWGTSGNTVSDVLIQNNYIHECGLVTLASAIDIPNHSVNVTVENNNLYYNGQGVTIRISPEAPENILAGPTNIIIRKNIISRSYDWGISTSNGTAYAETGSIYNNIFVDNGIGSSGDGGDIFMGSSSASDVWNIYNNTIYSLNNVNTNWAGNVLVGLGDLSDTGVTINFKNNLIYAGGASSSSGFRPIWDRWNTLTHSNNLVYRSSGASDVHVLVGTETSYNRAGVKTWEPTAQNTDPLFVNAGGSFALATDFQIGATSPAAESGVNVGLTSDYGGYLIPNSNNKYSMGAWQYEPNIPPPTPPTVTTQAVTGPGSTTATGNGNITDSGTAAVSAWGVCVNKTGSPTTSDTVFSGSGSGTPGAFTAAMTGLDASTLYYVRAYATNSVDTSYGGQVTFSTTGAYSAPTVTTEAVTDISYRTATGNGTITANGGQPVYLRGVCWGTSLNPTVADSVAYADFGGDGVFTSAIAGLTNNTLYHVRAFGTNSQGTAYGSDVTFTTTTALVPTLTTQNPTYMITTATLRGNVTDDGGGDITERGFCIGATANPTVAGTHYTVAGTTGAMQKALTGLSKNTTYHIRPYATNSTGTGYGSDKSFKTFDHVIPHKRHGKRSVIPMYE